MSRESIVRRDPRATAVPAGRASGLGLPRARDTTFHPEKQSGMEIWVQTDKGITLSGSSVTQLDNQVPGNTWGDLTPFGSGSDPLLATGAFPSGKDALDFSGGVKRTLMLVPPEDLTPPFSLFAATFTRSPTDGTVIYHGSSFRNLLRITNQSVGDLQMNQKEPNFTDRTLVAGLEPDEDVPLYLEVYCSIDGDLTIYRDGVLQTLEVENVGAEAVFNLSLFQINSSQDDGWPGFGAGGLATVDLSQKHDDFAQWFADWTGV